MNAWQAASTWRGVWHSLVAYAAAGVMSAPLGVLPALAETYYLTIGETTINVSGKESTALSINGTVPGPTLRFTEGEDLVINVTNTLDEDTSIHWHGMIVPSSQDGVPGLSFAGIKPGTTHTYRFPAQQSGTYWFHSHSGLQEQSGVYGSIVIEPQGREPFRYDRDYVVVLSDWHDTRPEQILANLKSRPGYYSSEGQGGGGMDMMMDDVADVSGYTFLVNGKNAEQNWTALFTPGERVRLRFINAAAMTYFDVRIPGLEMTVVQADGNNVQPVKVEEFRMAVAETYDVVVQPTEDRAYSIIAESMERAGMARATLAPRAGMAAAVPEQRQRPQLTMADMAQGGMGQGSMGQGSMDHAAMGHGTMPPAESAPAQPPMSGMDHAAMGHGSMAPASQEAPDPFYAPGSGLTPEAADGGKFLSYADLEAQQPRYEVRAPTREIEIRLTGDMARYVWSINGQVYPEAEPIRLTYGERVRFKFVNETMMVHPMHLHGMWTLLDNGNGERNPAKHVVSIAPATTVFAEVEVDAPGRWAFHCHLLYHMESGMFREVIVEGGPPSRTTG